MTSRRILQRIDEHMARGNEHMARGNELMDEIREEIALHRAESERGRAVFERNRAESERVRAESERNRAFLEDQRRITDAAMAENQRAFRDGSERVATAVRDFSAEFARVMDDVGDAVRELREESRAHTKAIFELLDRLDDGASPATG